MALKTKAHVPQDSVEEVSNEPVEQKQISFDDIDFEAEYVDIDAEAEIKQKKYYTITGKEQQYEPQWEKISVSDLEIGDEFEGRPEVTIFEKDDKSYNAMKVRVMDDGEILDLYFNYPKKDYPYVKDLKNIRTGTKDEFDFYLNCFDVVFSVLKCRDERNVVDSEGKKVNKFTKVPLETLMKFVDSHERIGVRIIEGSPYNDYTSWEIYTME